MEDKGRIILFRFLAYLVDSIGLNIVGYALNKASFFSDVRITIIIRIVIITAYMVFFHSKTGQTPGKALLKIRVFDYQTNQGITVKQAFLRQSLWIGLFVTEIIVMYVSPEYTMMIITPISLVLCAVIIVTAFTDSEGRALHDKIAGTVVRDVFVRRGEN